MSVAVLARNILGHGPMASAVAQAYNEDLGQSPQRGPGSGGQSPLEAETFLVFGRTMEAANLPNFVQFGAKKKLNICVIFTKKIMSGHETGGLEQNWGGPGPGLKPSLTVIPTVRI